MMAGTMNHAASLLATYARESKFRLRREDYARPHERFGRAAIVADAGDHLQLPPSAKAEFSIRSVRAYFTRASRWRFYLSERSLCVPAEEDDAFQR